jgi:hypothetical protein
LTKRTKKPDSTAVAASLDSAQLGCRALGHMWPRSGFKWVVEEDSRPRVARRRLPCQGGCGVEKVFRMQEIRKGLWRRLGEPYLDYSKADYLLEAGAPRPTREECDAEMLRRDLDDLGDLAA